MDTGLTWKEIYEHWKYTNLALYYDANRSLPVEKVFVDYKDKTPIYGYDWLTNDEAIARIELIKKDPIGFLYFTKPTNKGTIQTAEMLTLSQSEEERAAIWIAATTFELMQKFHSRTLYDLNLNALHFLQEKYWLWHHAMKKLVPDILIPHAVLDNSDLNDLDTVLGLIQMNALMLLSTHRVLFYYSVEENENFSYETLRK